MTQNRRIVLNIVATYGRSLYAMAIGLFCGWWMVIGLGGLTAVEMVKYKVRG